MRAKLVLTTAPDRATAETLANGLVEGRLAACANIIPGISSIYRWHGAVEKADELLLTIITEDDKIEALTAWIIANHPYDVPKVVVLPIEAGSQAYLSWITESVA